LLSPLLLDRMRDCHRFARAPRVPLSPAGQNPADDYTSAEPHLSYTDGLRLFSLRQACTDSNRRLQKLKKHKHLTTPHDKIALSYYISILSHWCVETYKCRGQQPNIGVNPTKLRLTKKLISIMEALYRVPNHHHYAEIRYAF
jgi:hypothetical protein